MDIQRIQAVLVDASACTTGDAVRRWCEREGGQVGALVRMRARSIEFSDDPQSRMARDQAFVAGMHDALHIAMSMSGLGLLVVDISGLQVDQVNRLSNNLDRTAIPVMRLCLEGTEADWPRTRVTLSPTLLDPWPAVSGYDIVGDAHGCAGELEALLEALGCTREDENWSAAPGRRVVFVGDLVDRGPDPVGVLRLVSSMCARGEALCVTGNHDWHLLSYLSGRKAPSAHGMNETQVAMAALSPAEREDIRLFLKGLPHQLLLDDGRLIVAHAGCPERLQGVVSERAIRECIFGVMTGRNDDGTPMRHDWAEEYRGDCIVVHGHVPLVAASEINGVWDVDTACAFGNALTALRFPAMQLVSVPAHMDWTDGHPTALRLADERNAMAASPGASAH